MAKKIKKTVAKSNILKKNLLAALEKSLGVVTTACKKCKCSRKTFYQYMKQDENFAKEVKDIEEIALDFAESKLHQQIQQGNTTATIFFLKTKGRHRGYIEKQEISQTTKHTFKGDPFEQIRKNAGIKDV